MSTDSKTAPPAGINPADIIYILFRRKWLILLFALVGVAAAAVFYFQAPATYSSEAKLFIRYVLENKLPTGAGTDSTIRQPDAGGKNIIASEVEVLTSYDLAVEVAEKVGARKILPDDPSATAQKAAVAVSKGLKIEVPRQSDVVRIVFQHSDPTVVQPVLKQIIASYLTKHDEIHRTSGLFDDVLSQQTDALRSEVARTEEDLRTLKLKTGISSIEDSKRAYSEEVSKIRQEINDTTAQMAERQASLASMRQSLTPAQTNATAVTNSGSGPAVVPPQIVTQYKALLGRLDSLRQRELSLSQQFTGENLVVKAVQAQIAEAMKTQSQLETDHPGLLNSGVVASSSHSSPQTPGSTFDPVLESARIAALQAKLDTLQKLLAKSTSEIKAVHEAEPELLRLQRKKDMDETKYRQFQTSLERARFEESLGAGRLSNIGVAQSPSPAARESREALKIIGIILAAGLGLGLGLAFLLEMYLRPSIKMASEMERRFRTEVFLSIPALRLNGHTPRNAMLAEKNKSSRGNGEPDQSASTQVVPWDPANPLQPYYEGLRDRVMTWFDNKGLVKKPKLVAVTSCGAGAGVSSIAAGLAATFSETGDGRVLLVDMNVGQGAAHSFYKGKPGCGLDEALESGKLGNAQVNDNLYVVAEEASNSDKLPSVLPRRFTSLVPKLKATDFDYIIFDMPPVTPITMTPRLSAYMDMVLLVVESEKTTPTAAKQATDLLGQSRANVAAVMNKTKTHNPKWLSAS